MNQTKTNTITSAMDIMAGFELLPRYEQKQVLQSFIDSLGSYPKPNRKGDKENAPNNLIGAYLFVSKARSTAKLCLFGYIDYDMTPIYINRYLMNALTLLVD